MESLKGKDVFKAMNQGLTILESLKAFYWHSAGTALGLKRESRGYIEHDTDIDVEVYISKDLTTDIIKQAFLDKGYRLYVSFQRSNIIFQQAFIDEQKIVYDIYYYYYRDDKTLYNHNDKGTFLLPFKYVKTLIKIRGYKVPKPIKDYLVYRFGVDWKTPKSIKGGWETDAGTSLNREYV